MESIQLNYIAFLTRSSSYFKFDRHLYFYNRVQVTFENLNDFPEVILIQL